MSYEVKPLIVLPSMSETGLSKIKRVQVAGHKFMLLKFAGDDTVYSTRNDRFDIRQQYRVNRNLRLAWCGLTGMKYTDLMGEVARLHKLDVEDGVQSRFDDVYEKVLSLVYPPMTRANKQKAVQMIEAINAGRRNAGEGVL